MPFGQIRASTGDVKTDYAFTGQKLETADGLMYYGARDYDAKIGRFIQPDPIIPNLYNPQSLNRYSYARNNPLRYNDPTGYAEIGDTGGGGMDWPPPPPDPSFSTDSGGVSDPVAPTDTAPPAASTGESQQPSETIIATASGTAGIDPSIQVIFVVATGGQFSDTDGSVQNEPGGPPCIEGGMEAGCTGGALPPGGGGVPPKPPAGGRGNSPAAQLGNQVHYDERNGGTGTGLPSQLQEAYPKTEFGFSRRGGQGPDATVTGGMHPSQYPNSKWPSSFDFGDFKPNTASGARRFFSELRSGKLPQDTVPLPYDPTTGNLIEGGFYQPLR